MSQNRNMKPKRNLIETTYFNAIYNILTSDSEYVERKIRKWACIELNTSYLDTFKIEWPTIMLLYYESQLENKTKNELITIAKEEFLDEIIEETEFENERFRREMEKEVFEKQQVKASKNKKQSTNQDNNKEIKKPKIKEFNLKFDTD